MDLTALDSTSRFAVPNRSLSRSPTRSPSRRQPSYELDPLLSNLSPTSTLEALEATQAVESGGTSRSSILRESVAAATTSERALGIRAALAAKKTREWYQEIIAWRWPTTGGYQNGFDLPPVRDRLRTLGDDGHSKRLEEFPPDIKRSNAYDNAEKEVYWGSLPANVALEYEDRVDIISDEMEILQLDELKDYVRDVHLATGSRRSSLQGPDRNNGSAPAYNRLGDFTAVITATIMQALPIITQLYLLLDTWCVRLTVLRQVPGFLACLEESQLAINSGWSAVSKSEVATEKLRSSVSREAFITMRSVLERRISDLGRRLDSMLDMLEGRDDVLPEKWIDIMDNVETEFGTWVVETESQVLETELRKKESNEVQKPRILDDDGGGGPTKEHPPIMTRDKPDAMSQTPLSARFTSSAIKGQGHPDPSDLEHNERIGADQETVATPVNSHLESHLSNPPNELSSTSPHSVETETTDAGSVYNLLSGLLGHRNADTSDMNPNSPGDQSYVQRSGNLHVNEQPSAETTRGANPTPTTKERILKSGLRGELPGQELSPPTVPTSQSSGAPEFSRRDVGKVDVANNTHITTVNPRNLADSESLSVNSEMEILDTLEAELLEQKHGPAARPGPLVFHKSHSRAVSNVSSDADTSNPGSATSEYFSNMSSPEIRDASRAEYFAGPVEVTTPSFVSRDPMSPDGTVSRQSSQRTERGDNNVPEGLLPSNYASSPTSQRSRASTLKRDLGVNDVAQFKDGFFPSTDQPDSELVARKGSLVSEETAPQNLVRKNAVRQNEGHSSASRGLWLSESAPMSPGQPLTSALLRLQNEESVSTAIERPIQPFELNNKSKLPSEDRSKKNSKDTADQSALDSPPPIPPKSRHRFEDVSDLGPGSTPIKVRQRNRADPTGVKIATPKSAVLSSRTSVQSSGDQLETRISSILTDIPARIQLTSGPETDAPDALRLEGPQDPQTPGAGLRAMRLMRSQSSVPLPPMILTPADPKSPKPRAQNGDPEIRLYHLHQSGKAAPIKLYIRLVGENGERVMVRIGGGWADLGEYLKEYVTHHGRRSVSDGRFEIQGLPQSQSSSPVAALTGHSGSHGTPRSRPSSPSMPNSRNRRLSELASSEVGLPTTPENPAFSRQDSIPRPRESSPASMRPPSRQSWTEDDSPLGLAGPRTKKIDISPRKQAWVDDMIGQARNTSAEKKKAGEGDFGDLGKVGGTKRVFMKSKKEG